MYYYFIYFHRSELPPPLRVNAWVVTECLSHGLQFICLE